MMTAKEYIDRIDKLNLFYLFFYVKSKFQWIEKSVSLSIADWYDNGPGFLYINIGISFPLQRSQTFTWSCITYDNIYSGYLVPSLNSSGNDVILFDTNYFKQTSVVTFYVDIIGL